MARSTAARAEAPRGRGARLGFRIDSATKKLVERAARLERRSLTDFCLSALADAARHSVDKHSVLVLSDADRAAFFDVLVHPPKPHVRLRRAVSRERARVERQR